MSAWPARRWYVAWHPESPVGILRAKDEPGLTQWRGRRWRDFPPGPVVILDVTVQMGRVWAAMALPRSGDSSGALPPAHLDDSLLALLLTDDGPDLVLRSRSAPTLPGEVADLSRTFREIIKDLRRATMVERHGLERAETILDRQVGNHASAAYVTYAPLRFFVWAGVPPSPAVPEPGGPVDGVGIVMNETVAFAATGRPFRVEAGGVFDTGDELATDAEGRAVRAQDGDRSVARALQGAGEAGARVWAVFA